MPFHCVIRKIGLRSLYNLLARGDKGFAIFNHEKRDTVK